MTIVDAPDPRSYRLEPRYQVLKNPEVHAGFSDEFRGWLAGRARAVAITPMRDIPVLQGIHVKARENECYANASAVVQMVPGSVYVEGFLDIPLSRHAWNKIGETYFDATAKFLSFSGRKPIYYAALLLEAHELAVLHADIEKVGTVAKAFFLKNAYSKRGEIEPAILPDFIRSCSGFDD